MTRDDGPAPGTAPDRLQQVRTRLEQVAGLPIGERPALFSWVNDELMTELAAMETEG